MTRDCKLIVGLGNPSPYEGTRHNAGFIFVDLLRKIFSNQACACQIAAPSSSGIAASKSSAFALVPNGSKQKKLNDKISQRAEDCSSDARSKNTLPCLFGPRYLMGLKSCGQASCKDLESKLADKYKGELSICRIRGDSGEERELLLLKPMTYMNLSGDAVLKLVQHYGIKPHDIVVVHDELDVGLGKVKYKLGGGDAGHNGLKSITGRIGANYHRIRIGIGRPRVLCEEDKEADFSRFAVDKWVLGKFTSWELGNLSCNSFFELGCDAIREHLEVFQGSLWFGMHCALKQFKILVEQKWT